MKPIQAGLNMPAPLQMSLADPNGLAASRLACSKQTRSMTALQVICLVLSLPSAGVLYGGYLMLAPMLLALWAADGVLHALTTGTQSRNRSDAVTSIAKQRELA